MRISIIESLVYHRHCASLDNYDAWDEEAGTAQVADAVTESIAVGVDRGEMPPSALPAKYKPKLKRPQPMPSPSNPPPPTPSPSNPPPDEHSTPKGVAHASPPLASCSDATAPGPVEEEKQSWKDKRNVVRKSASSMQSNDDDADNNDEPRSGALAPSELFVSVASTASYHTAIADDATAAQPRPRSVISIPSSSLLVLPSTQLLIKSTIGHCRRRRLTPKRHNVGP